MNRAQRRNLYNKAKKRKHNQASVMASNAEKGITPDNAQDILDNLPIMQIVAGINNLLSQIEQRNTFIYDWDDKARTLYRLQMRRGKIYYLSEHGTPKELKED